MENLTKIMNFLVVFGLYLILYPESSEGFVNLDLDWSEIEQRSLSSPWSRETKRMEGDGDNTGTETLAGPIIPNAQLNESDDTIFDPAEYEKNLSRTSTNDEKELDVKRIGNHVSSITNMRLPTVYLGNLGCYPGGLFRRLCFFRPSPIKGKIRFLSEDYEKNDQFKATSIIVWPSKL